MPCIYLVIIAAVKAELRNWLKVTINRVYGAQRKLSSKIPSSVQWFYSMHCYMYVVMVNLWYEETHTIEATSAVRNPLHNWWTFACIVFTNCQMEFLSQLRVSCLFTAYLARGPCVKLVGGFPLTSYKLHGGVLQFLTFSTCLCNIICILQMSVHFMYLNCRHVYIIGLWCCYSSNSNKQNCGISSGNAAGL